MVEEQLQYLDVVLAKRKEDRVFQPVSVMYVPPAKILSLVQSLASSPVFETASHQVS